MNQNQTALLAVEHWAIERLIPYARNVRLHSDEQVAQIAASIREFGFNNPVLVDPDGGIIAGHGRVLAARKLGLREVPIIVLGHLSENQRRAFMLADNQLALNASWNLEMLRLELEALAEDQVDLDLLGFSDAELKEVLKEQSPVGKCDPDEAPEPPEQPTSRAGDLWVMDEHRLLCGDGTNPEHVNRVLEGSSCDMVFTDLPYNVNYEGKDRRRLKLANDNLGEDFPNFLSAACSSMLAVNQGATYICMSSGELHRLHDAFYRAGGHWSTYIIWAKNLFTLGRSDYQRQFEPILYGWREGKPHYWCGDRNQGDVWEIDKPFRNELHPTMKPIELVERAIANSSQSGEIVLDPFGGAGSTLIASANLNRRARLIEIHPRYTDVIVRRWQNYTGHVAVLGSTNASFDDIAAERSAAESLAAGKGNE